MPLIAGMARLAVQRGSYKSAHAQLEEATERFLLLWFNALFGLGRKSCGRWETLREICERHDVDGEVCSMASGACRNLDLVDLNDESAKGRYQNAERLFHVSAALAGCSGSFANRSRGKRTRAIARRTCYAIDAFHYEGPANSPLGTVQWPAPASVEVVR